MSQQIAEIKERKEYEMQNCIKAYTLGETAALLDVSGECVRQWILKGKLKATSQGWHKSYMIPLEEFNRFLYGNSRYMKKLKADKNKFARFKTDYTRAVATDAVSEPTAQETENAVIREEKAAASAEGRNTEGYSDPTAYGAVYGESRGRKEARLLKECVLYIIRTAGFEVKERLTFIDKRTGREYH